MLSPPMFSKEPWENWNAAKLVTSIHMSKPATYPNQGWAPTDHSPHRRNNQAGGKCVKHLWLQCVLPVRDMILFGWPCNSNTATLVTHCKQWLAKPLPTQLLPDDDVVLHPDQCAQPMVLRLMHALVLLTISLQQIYQKLLWVICGTGAVPTGALFVRPHTCQVTCVPHHWPFKHINRPQKVLHLCLEPLGEHHSCAHLLQPSSPRGH